MNCQPDKESATHHTRRLCACASLRQTDITVYSAEPNIVSCKALTAWLQTHVGCDGQVMILYTRPRGSLQGLGAERTRYESDYTFVCTLTESDFRRGAWLIHHPGAPMRSGRSSLPDEDLPAGELEGRCEVGCNSTMLGLSSLTLQEVPDPDPGRSCDSGGV